MLVDFDQVFMTMGGEPLIREEKGKKVDATLKEISVEALLSFDPTDKAVKGPEKARRFDLAILINKNGGKLKVESEDIVLMKELIGDGYPPIVVGQAYKFLEGDKDEEKEK